MDKSEKNSTVQIMRGIAIIVVLLWHSISQVKTDWLLKGIGQLIICFHMPTFFAIAGYLFERNLNKYVGDGRLKFLVNKAKHLLVPYVFWTVLLWSGVNIVEAFIPSTVEKLSAMGFAPMSVKKMLWGILTYENYYTQHLWFLYVLYVFFIINITLKDIGKKVVCFAIWLILGFVSVIVEAPNIVGRIMLWGCFFCFGRIMATGEHKIKNKNVSIIVAFVFMSILRWITYTITGNILIVVMVQAIKYLEGFLGIGVILIVAKQLQNYTCLKDIGDYSYDIYLMHNPYIVALGSAILSKLLNINSYIVIAVTVTFGIMIPIHISRFAIRKNEIMSFLMLGIERKK